MIQTVRYPIVAREKLDFDLDGDIPRFWLDNDPFKTRFLDALSTLFPEGEKFFINCVRDYRDRITDPQLAEDVKAFTRQEGQHAMVHRQFNERLRRQGIPVDTIERWMVAVCEGARRYLPAVATLSDTAACEHVTATLAHGLFRQRDLLERADPRMRALYAWHAIEEVEHKAVAFDVLSKVAGAGYFARIVPMLVELLVFPLGTLLILNLMLKCDGFGWRRRLVLWTRGLWWLYGPGGMFLPLFGRLFAYFKPGFHPWQQQSTPGHRIWVETYGRTGDAVAAGNAMNAAGI